MLGDSAMHAMASADVFISGMGGLGIEIGEPATFRLFACMIFVFVSAKNIILAGVKVLWQHPILLLLYYLLLSSVSDCS